MTHDELLAKINQQKDNAFEGFVFSDAFDALRAVVELHKPWDVETEGGTFTLCNDCSRRVDSPGYGILYPCKTIQAIEKELS